MKFASFLNPELIILNKNVKSKEQAIELLVEKIIETENINLEKNYIIEKIKEREKIGSTIIGDGIFIPHARLENYNDLLFGILIPEHPIDENIKMIFLVLISDNTSTTYLGALSAISQIASKRNLIEQLINIKEENDFIEILHNEQIKIKKEIHVEDIMRKEFTVIYTDMTIKEVLDIFYTENILYAPVVNNEKKFLGEIHILYILQKALPDYASMLSNLRFITSLEPLDRFLKEEKLTYVKDIMKKPEKTLKPTSSIVEAALELRNGCKDIPVIDNNEHVVGIINCRQVLHKVLRA